MPDPVLVAVAVRRALYRPAVRWTVIGAVALVTLAVTGALVRAAADARAHWGETRPVAVAQQDLEPGAVVDRANVAIQELPEALIGEAALPAVPTGSVVRFPVVRGEPLVAERMAPEGLTGVAALVPAGHRAVGIPAGQQARPPLQPSDRVDVLVVLPPGAGAPGPAGEGGAGHTGHDPEAPALTLARGALVVHVDERSATVAVPAADAPRLAYAVTAGAVVLVLTGT